MAGGFARLQALLSFDLLQRVAEVVVPMPGVSSGHSFDRFFGSSHSNRQLAARLTAITLKDVFLPLSKIPLAEYPDDVLSLVPAETHDMQFPALAFGLLMLLDQVSRLVLKQHNVRWIYGFFDNIAVRLAVQLDKLEPNLRADSIDRWLQLRPDFSWEDAMLRCTLFAVPLLHSEEPGIDRRAQELSETHRRTVEAHYQRYDPARTNSQADVDYPKALPDLIQGSIPPKYYDKGRYDDFFFFSCQVNRAHSSPLSIFSRFPWRNAPLGRLDTAKEAAFLHTIEDFARLDPKIAADIRRDVVQGIWRPLTLEVG